MSELRLSVVLPVHNQADHLENAVTAYADALAPLSVSREILLVPNGCTDDTEKVCAKLVAAHPEIRVVRIEGKGWGRAVRLGVAAARGETVLYTNAARTAPEVLHEVAAYALANPEKVVKAKRVVREKLVRRVGSTLYNLECRLLFGVQTSDVNGTPKAFPRSYAELTQLERNDDLVDLEFLWRCRRYGRPVVELPVSERPRHGGVSTTRLKSAWRMCSNALRMRVAGSAAG